MEFYRYDVYRTESECNVILSTFYLEKETPRGYWIANSITEHCWHTPRKWIPKESKKRFAYPTKEEAKFNIIKRMEKRLKILKSQMLNCQIALTQIESVFKK